MVGHHRQLTRDQEIDQLEEKERDKKAKVEVNTTSSREGKAFKHNAIFLEIVVSKQDAQAITARKMDCCPEIVDTAGDELHSSATKTRFEEQNGFHCMLAGIQ